MGVRQLLVIGSLLTSSIAAGVMLWSVIPAPLRPLALLAVAAGEWSLRFGLLGLAGGVLGAGALAAGGGWPAWVAIGIGLLAATLALVPPVQVANVARTHGVSLSVNLLRAPRAGPEREAHTRVLRGIPFATVAGQTLSLDAYLPTGSNDRAGGVDGSTRGLPAIVVVHGGAWSGGQRSEAPDWNYWLTEQGFAVIDVDYRIQPQPNWQTATEDVKGAVSAVKRDAVRYGIDPDRIALLGRSAGGHLALLAAYTASTEGIHDSRVRAVVAFYAPTDLTWGYDNPANQRVIDGPETLRRFIGGDPLIEGAAYDAASPVTHVSPGTAPTLLFHGGRDQYVLRAHMDRLGSRLQSAGVAHRTVSLPYGQHGFDVLFDGWSAQLVRPLLLRFLRDHLT